MNEVSVESTEQLITKLNSLPNHFFYRGHANADWPLESSLERVIGANWCAEAAARFEERSLMLFQSKFHLYDRENIQPNSKLSWLSIMQHYGVPTRLLDFTESPYVALYFALNERLTTAHCYVPAKIESSGPSCCRQLPRFANDGIWLCLFCAYPVSLSAKLRVQGSLFVRFWTPQAVDYARNIKMLWVLT